MPLVGYLLVTHSQTRQIMGACSLQLCPPLPIDALINDTEEEYHASEYSHATLRFEPHQHPHCLS